MMIGTGPGSWLAHADAAGGSSGEEALADVLSLKLAGLASVSDQSSGYRIFRLGGAHARDLLQRGAFIDLHTDRFARGSSAVTVVAHVGVILWQVADDPVYDIAVFRSYADNFLHWFASAKAAL
jgi:sarcosine oxidase subunit gamma